MRGVTYDYEFKKPDKTKLVFTGQSMPEVVANIRILTKKHYELDFRISADTIYNIIRRPEVAHKFYASKVKIQKVTKPVTTPQPVITTVTTPQPVTTAVTTTEQVSAPVQDLQQTQQATHGLTDTNTIPSTV